MLEPCRAEGSIFLLRLPPVLFFLVSFHSYHLQHFSCLLSFPLLLTPCSPLQPEQSTLDRSRIIQLSADNPRAYLYKDFLTQEECDFLIDSASTKLQR